MDEGFGIRRGRAFFALALSRQNRAVSNIATTSE
jgi:hypothetical protein